MSHLSVREGLVQREDLLLHLAGLLRLVGPCKMLTSFSKLPPTAILTE